MSWGSKTFEPNRKSRKRSEDWKRLQGLGLTNKFLESRSLSDLNVYMYTTAHWRYAPKIVHYQTKNLNSTTERQQFAQN